MSAAIDPHSFISLSSSRNVKIAGNAADGLGKFGKALITVAPSATNVQGAADGIAIKR